MPYIGHSPTNAGSFVELDDISSGFNGSTAGFTMQVGAVSVTPSIENLLICLDGVVQQPTSAFSISGSTITFTENVPSGTDFYGILMGQSATVGQGTITASEMAVTGNGTNGQLLKTDGDGTFTWIDQNTVTAPASGLQGNTLASSVTASSLTSVGTLTGLAMQGANYTTLSIQSGTTTHGAILNLGSSDDIDYGSITQFASGAGEGGRMRFIAGTTETMNLRGNKVGVGTNNPDSLIHAKVTTDTSETIRIQNDDSLTTVGVSSDGYSFHTYQHSLYWASWDGSTWSTKGRMDSHGNLGVGTTDFNNMSSSSYAGLKVGGATLQDSGGGNGSATFLSNNAYVGGSNNMYHDGGGACSSIGMTQGDIYFYTFDGGGGSADAQWSPTSRLHISETGVATFSGNITQSKDGNLRFTQTAGGSGESSLVLTANNSTGDSFVRWETNSTTFCLGLDNSDGDKFILSAGSDPHSNSVINIQPDGSSIAVDKKTSFGDRIDFTGKPNIGNRVHSVAVSSGSSSTYNMNGAGGNCSGGFIVGACHRDASITADNSVCIYAHVHTQGANEFSTIIERNDDSDVTIARSGGNLTLTNNGNSTVNFVVKYLLLTAFDTSNNLV